MMKNMENNIKTHIQETIKKVLKKQEMRFNIKIDKILLKLKDQVKKTGRCNKQSKILNNEFDHLKNNVTSLMKLNLQKKPSFQ